MSMDKSSKRQEPKDENGSATHPADGEPGESLLSHLIELRDRLLRVVLAVLVMFLVLFPFANPIYTALATPLMAQLPEGSSMIAIDVAAPFLVPFKLVFLLAFVLAIPYVLYQLWAFVAPGLYEDEKRLAGPLVLSSTLLFYLGMAFAYFVVFPLIFAFFTATAPEGVSVMTDISRYLSFVIMLFIAFGIAFEMPIATILLVATGATTPESLARKRPYVIVGVFVVGMVLTPPDIISQTLLALPMWLLFEIGLVLSRIMVRRKAARERDDRESGDEPPPSGPSSSGPRPSGPKLPSPSTHAAQSRGGSTPIPKATYSPARVHGLAAGGAVADASQVNASSRAAGAQPVSRSTADQGDFQALTPEAMDDELDRAAREIDELRAANRARGAELRSKHPSIQSADGGDHSRTVDDSALATNNTVPSEFSSSGEASQSAQLSEERARMPDDSADDLSKSHTGSSASG